VDWARALLSGEEDADRRFRIQVRIALVMCSWSDPILIEDQYCAAK
jgi:hypothetical protein